ncbi:MAG: ABC-F family ATP-binding cassette domain-containing protein [Micromonosporaceae bacterium]
MNLVNLEKVGKAYGPLVLLRDVSLGVAAGERIGVVGRNGGGKTTLVSILAKAAQPDTGRVTHARDLRVGYLPQRDGGGGTVREMVLGERPEHDWAGDPRTREVIVSLLPGAALDAAAADLSGGERRRAALARLLVAGPDMLVLDEPTNHLDIEAIDWLADHLRARGTALVVVTHDRWFLDAVCEQIWEVADAQVYRYEGGYSAYVLAKAERDRIAGAAERRRRNLLRKELAWLRRGPPARTSKPKFRIEAANALIAGEPAPRDTIELTRLATTRLGHTVAGLHDVTVHAGERTLLDHVTWQLGPGERVGVVGANGSGKTTLLRLLDGTLAEGSTGPVPGPALAVGSGIRMTGTVERGKTVKIGHLSQELEELSPTLRVIEAAEEVRKQVRIGRRELSASQLLLRFGFSGARQQVNVSSLSGGESRRLQLLRLMMDEPNVLLLDEPTNDLDVETLTELEDLLDGWPGSLVVVSHDRYFLERVTDHVLALPGDGRLAFLGGGVDEYLASLRSARPDARPAARPGARPAARPDTPATPSGSRAARTREARKELQRLERRLERLSAQEAELAASLSAHATDYEKLMEVGGQLRSVQEEKSELEERWLVLAEEISD